MTLDGEFRREPDGSYVVAFDRVIDRPIAKVWAALATPELLTNWLGEVEVEPRVGGKYVIRFRDSPVVMSGKITAFEPDRLLEYTWHENLGMPDSLARWELSSAACGCRLKLMHRLPRESAAIEAIGFVAGWHGFLDAIPEASDGVFVAYKDDKPIDEGYRARATEQGLIGKGRTERVLAFTLDRRLPGPITRVWDHLTKPELLAGWYGNGTIELRPGGKVHLMDGHIRGVVTQCRPPSFITYTWNVFNPDDPPDVVSAYPESYLTLQLEERRSEVLLRLSHLPILDRFEAQNAMGWHTFIDMAETALRGRGAQPRRAYMEKNAKLYGVDLANLAR